MRASISVFVIGFLYAPQHIYNYRDFTFRRGSNAKFPVISKPVTWKITFVLSNEILKVYTLEYYVK